MKLMVNRDSIASGKETFILAKMIIPVIFSTRSIVSFKSSRDAGYFDSGVEEKIFFS